MNRTDKYPFLYRVYILVGKTNYIKICKYFYIYLYIDIDIRQ